VPTGDAGYAKLHVAVASSFCIQLIILGRQAQKISSVPDGYFLFSVMYTV
jgi:hypothetical protein